MKIVIAHYKYYIQGGPEQYMFKFMRLAEENGSEVIPFSVNYPANVETKYADYFVGKEDAGANFDINNHKLGYLLEGAYHEFHNHEAYMSIRKLFKKVKPDLLYILIAGQLTADIIKAAKENDIPVIMRISDFRLLCGKYTLYRDGNVCIECMNGNYSSMIKHRCIKGSLALSILRAISCWYTKKFNVYGKVDAVITPPEFSKELLINAKFYNSKKVYVNPTFVDCKKIFPSYVYENYVLCLGRLAEEKGFEYVIKSLKYLNDVEIKIVITGIKESCSKELLEFINTNHLNQKVVFSGFKRENELEKIIDKALCIACPSVCYENMPNAVLEAYSYAKPVIASNLGSLSEMVIDGNTGYLFEAKNEKEIAECIRKMISDINHTKEMGKNAHLVCMEKYSPQKHWDRFMEIYHLITE